MLFRHHGVEVWGQRHLGHCGAVFDALNFTKAAA